MKKVFIHIKEGKEPGREDDIERKYQEAVALLPTNKEQEVREYCDAIFDSGTKVKQFYYRLGLRAEFQLHKIAKSSIKKISKMNWKMLLD